MCKKIWRPNSHFIPDRSGFPGKKKSFKLKSNGRVSFERYTVSRLFLEGLKSWAKELELHAVNNGKLLKVTE